MKISIANGPPSETEISTARTKAQQACRTRRSITYSIAFLTVLCAIIYSECYSVSAGVMDSKDVPTYYYLTMGLGTVALISWYRTEYLVLATILYFIETMITSVVLLVMHNSSLSSGVILLTSLLTANIILSIVWEIIVDSGDSKVKALQDINADENQHRCEGILKACRANKECEAYRLAVARQGRSLIVLEADAIAAHLQMAQFEAEEGEERRNREVACAILRSKESLTPQE